MSYKAIDLTMPNYAIIIVFLAILLETVLCLHCPSGLPRDETHTVLNHTCYGFVAENKNWSNAQKDCEIHNGRLAEINSLELQLYMYQRLQDMRQFDRSGLWIGSKAQRKVHERKWYWTTGTVVTFNNFLYQNYIQDGQCVMLRADQNGKWISRGCVENNWWFGYICEYETSDANVNSSTGIFEQTVIWLMTFISTCIVYQLH